MQEVCVLTRHTWALMEGLPVDRMRECLRLCNWVAVDVEGGGTTLQMSMFSSRGITSFILTGGFLPVEVRELVWDDCPVVLGSKAELARYIRVRAAGPIVGLEGPARDGHGGGIEGGVKDGVGSGHRQN